MAVTLVLFKKGDARKAIDLTQKVTLIGRRPECDVRIPLLQISRKHCQIVQDQDQTVVRDLGSSNGTFLNGERITEGVVNAGDRLSVGATTFTVQIDGQPQELVPPTQARSHSAAQTAGPPLEQLEPVEQLETQAPSAEIMADPAFEPLTEDDLLADLDPLEDSGL